MEHFLKSNLYQSTASHHRLKSMLHGTVFRLEIQFQSASLALGKDPSDTAKFPESFGFGPDAYIGKIDVFHQIHCLNMLRMSLRPNFDYYYGSKFPPGVPTNKLHNLHLGHCLHILLENLMCTGNVDIYTHYWMDAQKHAFPDFNINHKCRDLTRYWRGRRRTLYQLRRLQLCSPHPDRRFMSCRTSLRRLSNGMILIILMMGL